MDNIVHLKDFLWKKKFDEEVLPFFQHLNISCQHFRYGKEGLCIAKTDLYLFLFLTYVEKGEQTNYPSLMDRFYDIKENPRISEGEWVVEYIYQVDERHTKKLVERLERYKGNPQGILELKKNIKQ